MCRHSSAGQSTRLLRERGADTFWGGPHLKTSYTSPQLSRIEHPPPKGGPVLRTIEKYSGVDGNSVLRILIRKAKCYRGRKQHFRRKKYRLKIEKIGHRSGRPKRLKNLDFKPKIVCRHSSAGQSIRLLRESRGIPQREKMKNNFQFESILKNAKGDNKAFPKLGNVLMLPNRKNLQIDNSKKS